MSSEKLRDRCEDALIQPPKEPVQQRKINAPEKETFMRKNTQHYAACALYLHGEPGIIWHRKDRLFYF